MGAGPPMGGQQGGGFMTTARIPDAIFPINGYLRKRREGSVAGGSLESGRWGGSDFSPRWLLAPAGERGRVRKFHPLSHMMFLCFFRPIRAALAIGTVVTVSSLQAEAPEGYHRFPSRRGDKLFFRAEGDL